MCANRNLSRLSLLERVVRTLSQLTMASVKQLNDVPLDTWETIASYWDKSIGKDGNIYWKKLQEPSLRRLLGDHLGKESCRALDLATGNGICARWLAKHGARVTATDGSENMVQIAKNWMKGEERSDSVDFTKLDVTQTEDFDAFIAATVCFQFWEASTAYH